MPDVHTILPRPPPPHMTIVRINTEEFARLDLPTQYTTYRLASGNVRQIAAKWCAHRLMDVIDHHPSQRAAARALGIAPAALRQSLSHRDRTLPDLEPYVVFDFHAVDTDRHPSTVIKLVRETAFAAWLDLVDRRRRLVQHVLADHNGSVYQAAQVLDTTEVRVKSDHYAHLAITGTRPGRTPFRR